MTHNNELALIILNNIQNLSVGKKHDLLGCFSDAEELIDSIKGEKDTIVTIIGEKNYQRLALEADYNLAERYLKECNSKRVSIITLESEDYPFALKNIYDPPLVLYAKGNIDLLSSRCFGIVGTRKITSYGKDVTNKFASELAMNGFTIVSGLARGVDTYAHTAALDSGGDTIAVLGNGLDIVYPSENRDLARKIEESGLIISEFPLSTPPLGYNFPLRNRIISGLSDGILITEAGLGSGSMITANNALEQYKRVFAVPGNIFSSESKGTNELIKNETAVKMVTEVNDIYVEYNLKPRESKVTSFQLDFVEQSVVDELEKGDRHFEELLSMSNLEVSKLLSVLVNLEVCGVIRKLPGNRYGIVNK